MYVVELDRAWTETVFLFQGFRIRQQQKSACCRKSASTSGWMRDARSAFASRPGRTRPRRRRTWQPLIGKVSFSAEMAQAEPVYQAAREQSLRILQAVRLGQALDVATVKEVVKGCVESILRNPAAMLWLARIKHKDEQHPGALAAGGHPYRARARAGPAAPAARTDRRLWHVARCRQDQGARGDSQQARAR